MKSLDDALSALCLAAVRYAHHAPMSGEPHSPTLADLKTAAREFTAAEEAAQPPHVRCGHSACSQHYIDTGKSECIDSNGPDDPFWCPKTGGRS